MARLELYDSAPTLAVSTGQKMDSFPYVLSQTIGQSVTNWIFSLKNLNFFLST